MLQGMVSGKKIKFKKGFTIAYNETTKQIVIFGRAKGPTEAFKIDVKSYREDKPFTAFPETSTISLPETFTFEGMVQLISLCTGLSFKETRDCLGFTRAFECV